MPLMGQVCSFFLFNKFLGLILYTNNSGEKWDKEETQQEKGIYYKC